MMIKTPAGWVNRLDWYLFAGPGHWRKWRRHDAPVYTRDHDLESVYWMPTTALSNLVYFGFEPYV